MSPIRWWAGGLVNILIHIRTSASIGAPDELSNSSMIVSFGSSVYKKSRSCVTLLTSFLAWIYRRGWVVQQSSTGFCGRHLAGTWQGLPSEYLIRLPQTSMAKHGYMLLSRVVSSSLDSLPNSNSSNLFQRSFGFRGYLTEPNRISRLLFVIATASDIIGFYISYENYRTRGS